MTDEMQRAVEPGQSSSNLCEKRIVGSRTPSNYIVGSMVAIGGIGFLLASFSSYVGKDFLPLGHPSSFIFVPQGLIMGLYGIAAFFLAIYLWTLIAIDFGSGSNVFDKNSGKLIISRRGLLRKIGIEIPLADIKAVKIDVREGFNAKRRLSLRLRGKKDLPLSSVGELPSLAKLEQEGAELARFLSINLEGN